MSSTEVQPKQGFLSNLISFLIMLAVVLGCSWLLRTFIISPYEIPSGSMETAIMTDDKVFAEQWTYWGRSPERGDIVTFEDPEMASRTLIKRVIATGGQTVDLRDGIVYVDDVALTEPYTHGIPSNPLSTQAPGVTVSYPYTVGVDEIWVMGDNRNNSADSRYFGSVPVSSVTGKACCIYWPLNRIGGLE